MKTGEKTHWHPQRPSHTMLHTPKHLQPTSDPHTLDHLTCKAKLKFTRYYLQQREGCQTHHLHSTQPPKLVQACRSICLRRRLCRRFQSGLNSATPTCKSTSCSSDLPLHSPQPLPRQGPSRAPLHRMLLLLHR